MHDTCIAPLSGSHFFSQFLLFASKLELFSISLEGSIELSGVDCTYSCKSRKDNRTKRYPLERWLAYVNFTLFLETGSRLAQKSLKILSKGSTIEPYGK